MCVVPHMSSCITTKLFAKSVEVAGWRLGWVGVGEGWSVEVFVRFWADLSRGCLSPGWHVEVRC